MAKIASSKSVPKGMQATYEAITTLTDAFCRDHLNDEYRELAQRMTAALCRKRPSPVVSGQPRSWACSIIYVLGQINFLSDRSMQPYRPWRTSAPSLGLARAPPVVKLSCPRFLWTPYCPEKLEDDSVEGNGK